MKTKSRLRANLSGWVVSHHSIQTHHTQASDPGEAQATQTRPTAGPPTTATISSPSSQPQHQIVYSAPPTSSHHDVVPSVPSAKTFGSKIVSEDVNGFKAIHQIKEKVCYL
ncbi:hypothetical protein BC937DRAFT_88448 [Endogone sp. FLAS-F59071]|nr:hypothetical protein BC937DRAFT_88448 [Endogone sp. FLAS-F59071]|eukprot:RUS18693.1 hypothetical protein BC937DRAFT_88448 [Endogone sp. FLAS-F59071]